MTEPPDLDVASGDLGTVLSPPVGFNVIVSDKGDEMDTDASVGSSVGSGSRKRLKVKKYANIVTGKGNEILMRETMISIVNVVVTI